MILLAFVALGGGAYLYSQNNIEQKDVPNISAKTLNEESSNSPSDIGTQSKQSVTKNGSTATKRYSNSLAGYEFTYPSELCVFDRKEDGKFITKISEDKNCAESGAGNISIEAFIPKPEITSQAKLEESYVSTAKKNGFEVIKSESVAIGGKQATKITMEGSKLRDLYKNRGIAVAVLDYQLVIVFGEGLTYVINSQLGDENSQKIIDSINFIPNPKMASFAECVANSGAKLYGAFWCPHCISQRLALGVAQNKLPYVECSNSDATAQTEACVSKKIDRYPTWIFADGSKVDEEISLDQISEKTSCVVPKI